MRLLRKARRIDTHTHTTVNEVEAASHTHSQIHVSRERCRYNLQALRRLWACQSRRTVNAWRSTAIWADLRSRIPCLGLKIFTILAGFNDSSNGGAAVDTHTHTHQQHGQKAMWPMCDMWVSDRSIVSIVTNILQIFTGDPSYKCVINNVVKYKKWAVNSMSSEHGEIAALHIHILATYVKLFTARTSPRIKPK